MTEAEWLVCDDPKPMLTFHPGKASHRKTRLLAVACCRKVWDSLRRDARRVTTVRWQKRVWAYTGGRFDPFSALESAERAVDAGENFADGLIGKSELRRAYEIADKGYLAADAVLNWIVNKRLPQIGGDRTEREIFATILTTAATASHLQTGDLRVALDYRANSPSDLTTQFQMLRDIFGNPFRKAKFNKKWRTDTALSLAQQMYESRDFSAMPILADALQDAGCDNEDILNHCRSDGPHVRGCWVVDLVLGKK